MKIEKLNDNQIRCTLTRADLDDRQLKLSELAYGTEKAKSLFREMMQQASYEFGFEAEDIPLMIEAIPLSADAIILIITKVEYPEELDTRFSKFSEASDDIENYLSENANDTANQGADDILGLFQRLQQDRPKSSNRSKAASAVSAPADTSDTVTEDFSTETAEDEEVLPVTAPLDITRLFVFRDFDTVGKIAQVLHGFYDDWNSLYRKPGSTRYYLFIRKGHHSPVEFNKVCNMIAEYSSQEKYSDSLEAYFDEHCELLIDSNALQTLASL